jgi:hypothetical protein
VEDSYCSGMFIGTVANAYVDNIRIINITNDGACGSQTINGLEIQGRIGDGENKSFTNIYIANITDYYHTTDTNFTTCINVKSSYNSTFYNTTMEGCGNYTAITTTASNANYDSLYDTVYFHDNIYPEGSARYLISFEENAIHGITINESSPINSTFDFFYYMPSGPLIKSGQQNATVYYDGSERNELFINKTNFTFQNLDNPLIFYENSSIAANQDVRQNDGDVSLNMNDGDDLILLNVYNWTLGYSRLLDPMFNGTYFNNTLDQSVVFDIYGISAFRNSRFVDTGTSRITPTELMVSPTSEGYVY